MPISRKKSCIPCRIAKARCNLERICSRCVDRDLCCHYDSSQPRSRQGERRPHLSDASTPRNSGEPPAVVGHEQANIASIGDFLNAEYQHDSLHNVTTGQDMGSVGNLGYILPASMSDSPEWATSGWLGDNISTSSSRNNPWSSNMSPLMTTDVSGDRSQTDLPNISFSTGPEDSGNQQRREHHQASQTWSAVLDQHDNEQPKHSFFSFSSLFPKPSGRDVTIYGTRFANILSQKKVTTTQSFLVTQVLLGQIAAYPKLLIQGRLPAFIYPTCVLNNRSLESCARNGTHECLPEPLAICASLVRMFYGRTPRSSSFIWKTILVEMKRLAEVSETYDLETLLAATQSMIVYVLLQAQDFDSIRHNDVGSMITILSETLLRLHESCNYESDIYQINDLTLREWVLNESMRRAASMLYVLESLLEVMVGRRDGPNCPGFVRVPLPCPRDLWDYGSNETWTYRLGRYLSSRTSCIVLKIRDIQQTHKPNIGPELMDRDSELVHDVGKWCESLDEFGTLVWMASLLD
ncbi:hypothetical protein BJ170DRAFT_249088 [Xylariales sp. AK1849]|nr:hypothetical protein BJ170DRAFT_249088 [Xylariales sp. AK1849]